MKILLIGQSLDDYGDLPYQSYHMAEMRDVNLGKELAKLDHEICLMTGSGNRLLDTGVQQVSWETLDPGGIENAFDWTIVTHIWGLKHLLNHQEHLNAVLAMPWAINLDGFSGKIYSDQHDIIGKASLIAGTTSLVNAMYQKKFPAIPTINSPYGFSDIQPCADPYPETKKPRLLLMTRWFPEYVKLVNRLAQNDNWEVWVVGPFHAPFYSAIAGRALSIEQRQQLFDERVRFITDLAECDPPSNNGEPLHGPVRRSLLDPFIANATIGINVTPGQKMPVLNCKLYDYLGAGLAVVSDSSTPNTGDILELQCGNIVYGDEWEATIQRTLQTLPSRAIVRQAAQLLGGWPVIASRWDQALKGLR